MTEPSRRTRGVQRGPRSAQVVEGVLAATVAELARAGFAGLTVDGVARAAGVNRTTIYRRWPTKAALLTAVVEPLLRSYDADPGTGSAHGDLLALMVLIRDNAARPEGRALIAASSEPELRELVGAGNVRTLAAFRRVLDRAVENGELAPDHDVRTVAHLVFHGVVMWTHSHDAPPTDDDLERILVTVVPPAVLATPATRRLGAPGADNRTALLDAAAAILIRDGHAAVTSRGVAAAAGLKPQLVHYYFRTMDDLVLEVFRRQSENDLRRQDEALVSAEPLRAMWALSGDAARNALVRELAAPARRRPDLRAELVRYVERHRENLVRAIESSGAGGGVPAPVLALAIAGVAQTLVAEGELDLHVGHEETVRFAERWLARPAGHGAT